jgi:hypothetical protein
MGLRPTQGDEKRLGPATTLHVIATLSFVIPSEAEGPAVPRTLPGNAEYYTQNKIVISTGRVMGLRPTQGDEKRLGPATTFHVIATLSFVIPSVPGFPTSQLSTAPLMWFSLKRTTCN